MSVSLAAVAGAAVVALELAATHGQHRVIAVAWILEAYAVGFGAPAFLSSLLPEISDETAEGAKRRRYTIARVLRAPWRRGSLLRQIASWLIIAPIVWVLVAQTVHSVVHLWILPTFVIAVALVLGSLLGLAGWIAVLIPKSWLHEPAGDVVTLRTAISRPDAASVGGALAAVLVLVAIALHLLELYHVWRF